MKHKTWFRLVLKAIGVYMICMGIPSMVSQLSNAIISFYYHVIRPGGGPWPYDWDWFLPQLLWWGGQIGIGLYLFFGGKWIVNLAIPSNRPYCPDCGYDLSRNASEHCPECGVALDRRADAGAM